MGWKIIIYPIFSRIPSLYSGSYEQQLFNRAGISRLLNTNNLHPISGFFPMNSTRNNLPHPIPLKGADVKKPVLLKKMEICKDQAFHFQSHLVRSDTKWQQTCVFLANNFHVELTIDFRLLRRSITGVMMYDTNSNFMDCYKGNHRTLNHTFACFPTPQNGLQ